MLTEVKNDYDHYFEDSNGMIQGVYDGHDDGVHIRRGHYLNGKPHGEFIWSHYPVRKDGSRYVEHSFFVGGNKVHDFNENPLSDEDKLLLVLKYGAPMLPKEA